MAYRLFTVVLDRTKFVSEAGFYFYIADFDLTGNPDPNLKVCPDDTMVLRGMDISTVAECLGVVALDG